MESSEAVFSGFEGTFNVTVTNNGPDVANFPGTYTPLMSFADNDFIFFPDLNVVQADCAFSTFVAEPRPPNFSGGSTILISTSPIAVGESITCFGRYLVGFQSGSRYLLWETVGFGEGALIDDSVPENNFVVVGLIIAPQPVNALNLASLLLLISFILFLGINKMFFG